VEGGGSLPNGIDPGGRRPPGRRQRRGRRLPKPGSYTGTRYHSAIGYRDSLPGVKITYLRPCSPPSACPVRGVKGSYGTQQQINRHVEEAIVASTREETARLAQGMPPQEITVTQDETCTGGLCLVAIEPVSNDMLLEQPAEARDHDTWRKAMAGALAPLKCQIIQSTSDEAPASSRMSNIILGSITRRTSSMSSMH
jgi:hypothetical protein